MFFDLTHDFYDGMPGFRMPDRDGSITEFTARIRPYLTHEASAPNYEGRASFEITEISFQTSLGTYLDAPRNRYEGQADIASLELQSLILDGVVIDARGCSPNKPLEPAGMPDVDAMKRKAVLINFGHDRHWGTEAYYDYPYVSREGLTYLLEAGIKLFGVDALSADGGNDPERPAHTWFLGRGVHIVENLRGLDQLIGRQFRFFSIPLKVRDAASFPIRAFAELR